MSTTEIDLPVRAPLVVPASRRTFLRDLGGRPALGYVAPTWFAAVMGTGIVANAAATLPVDVPGLRAAAAGIWVLAASLLLALLVATTLHRLRHREVARSHLDHPVVQHSFGAVAMALTTVAAGALLVGQPVVGAGRAVALAAVLWIAGAVLGLAVAVAVPHRMITGSGRPADAATGLWLLPLVAPMVSAATGPLLVPHLPAGQWRLALQLVCTMMFGLTLVASLVVLTMLWSRLVHHGPVPAAAVPTLWIVLGPLGQSTTAAHTLGATAPDVLPAPYGTAQQAMGVVYAAPVWGFAVCWLALVVALTVGAARRGLPFTLGWWSFTFPVGTLVTGTSGLAEATGATFLAVVAVGLYVALVAAWLVVATRTVRGAWTGRLLLPPVPSAQDPLPTGPVARVD